MLGTGSLLLIAGPVRSEAGPRRNFLRVPLASPLVRAGAVVVLLCGLRIVAGGLPWATLAVSLALLATAGALRLWATAMCLTAYLLGTLFLCMLGLHTGDRLQHTFSICLYLSAGLFVMETVRAGEAADSPWPAWARHAIPLTYVRGDRARSTWGIISPRATCARSTTRCAARQAWPSRSRAIPASIAASSTRAIAALFYTTYEPSPIGSVRRYKGLANSNIGNLSFREPNAFVD
jgi:hypothetical protein